ncbi:MAG TPA: ABC transporter permease [Gemmatimonadales bacterium]|nr:ABC transporter permease [Gemmatimonadales bacterium]
MNKILAVIRREFIERVRTRSFLIGTFIVPLLAGGLGYLPQALSRRQTATRHIVVLDATGGRLGARVDSALSAQHVGEDSIPRYAVTLIPAGERVDAIRDSVVGLIGHRQAPVGAPAGLLILTEDGVATGKVSYLGSDVTSFQAMSALRQTLDPLIRDERLTRLNADSAVKAAASLRVDLQNTKVTEGRVTGESGETSFLLAYIVDMFMYISLLLYGVQIMGSVIEEKSNKIIEILVSSLKPFQLLMGKVIGVGATGLLQLGIWAGTGLYLTTIFGRKSGAAAAASAAAQSGFTMPTVTPDLVVVILVFFLLGFFLYAGLYAAIGSMCNTQQEAQQAATPVTMIIVLGMIFMFSLINEPSGHLARVLTFIPLLTPLVVPVRYAISPLPLSEVALGVAVMIVGMIAVVWVGARVYRIGILSYGKRPSLRDLWRWIRTS